MSEPFTRTSSPALVGGRYALHGEIGRGGMATVHRGYDEVLQRVVAVKVLHAHLAGDPTFLDRFRREARAAAAVHHPNVVTVHDWGETGDGAYLVLQHVEGCSLREVLRHRGRLSPGEALAALEPAAEGLGAAHAAGLVHRDVKPENVLLGADGGVHITDFGLARAAASATATFGANVLVGSPHYLSPEAVRGEPLTPAADVYGLGVVLFECLTGTPPHEGESPLATAVAHTERRVAAPSGLVAGLPAALDGVVRVATHPDPAERHPDGATFATALTRAVPSGPAPLPVPADASPAAEAPVDETAAIGSAAPTRRVGEPPPAPTTVVAAPADADGQGDGPPPEDDPPRRRWLVALLVLGLLAGSALGGYLLWDRVLAPITPIPPVVGAEAAAATAQLEEAGFEVDIATERPHDLDVPEGHVLAQDPAGDARQGAVVTLTLSAGPRPVEVPTVTGDPRDEAVAALREAGLDPGIEERHHDEVPEGRVVAQDPAGGSTVDEASGVEVVVSLGPPPVEVPELRGLARERAEERLAERGLELRVGERRYDDGAPAGEILAQDAEPGTTLRRGETVTVVVSDGPQPVEVPNVRDEHVDDAVETLRSLGFEVEVERRGGLGAVFNPGRVVDQNPGPGAVRRPGDTVTVYAYEE